MNIVLKDANGRLLQSYWQDGKEGVNQFIIDEEDLPKGLLYYQLNSKYGSITKKMLRLE